MTKSIEDFRVWVDFNNCDRERRVRLNSSGTVQDLGRQGITLRDGLELVLYCLELEAQGTVAYSTDEGLWVAVVDWADVRTRGV
jgi:hypothetical protein